MNRLGEDTQRTAKQGNGDNVIQALEQSADSLGIDRTTLLQLTKDQKLKLSTLIGIGGKDAAVVLRCLSGVQHTKSGREGELVDVLSVYTGKFFILKKFLTHIGVDDPFVAVAKAQITRLPASDANAVFGAGKTDKTSASAGTPEKTRGASGHILTGTVYAIHNPENPTESVGFFGKDQSILKIFEAFGGKRYAPERIREKKQKRGEAIKALQGVLNLESVDESSGTGRAPRHIIEQRNEEVCADLRRAIADYQAQLNSLTYNHAAFSAAVDKVNVRSDPGGGLFTWYSRAMEAGLDVPEGLQLALVTLQDPWTTLTPKEEHDYTHGLLAFQRLHTFIDTNAALGGAARDIAEFQALDSSDPLKLDPKILGVDERMHALLRATGAKGEIPLNDFSTVVADSGLVKLRRELNGRIETQFGEEFKKAVQAFSPYFKSDHGLAEDTLGEVVSANQLRQSIYGVKLGVAMEGQSDEFRISLLGNDAYRALKSAMFLQATAAQNRDHLLLILPVEDFRRTVEQTIVAYRKKLDLDAQLIQAVKGTTQKDTAQSDSVQPEKIVEAMRQDLSTLPKSFKPVVVKGDTCRPAEVFLKTLHDPDGRDPRGRQWNLSELVAVGREKLHFGEAYSVERSQLVAQARTKIISLEHFAQLKDFYKAATLCTRAVDIADEIANAKVVLKSPLVRVAQNKVTDAVNANYLTDAQVEIVRSIAKFLPEYQQLELDLAENVSLAQRAKPFQLSFFYDGEIGPTAPKAGEKRSLQVGRTSFEEIARQETAADGNITFYRRQPLLEAVERLEKDFTPVAAVPTAQIDLLKLVCSRAGAKKLAAHNLSTVNPETFKVVVSLGRRHSQSNQYVSKRLVARCNEIAANAR